MLVVAYCSLAISVICSLVILADLLRHREQMAIMNVVWPLTALYSGIVGLLLYYKIGRNNRHTHTHVIDWRSVTKSTLHCGSGCTLGDICAEAFVSVVPVTVLQSRVFGSWAIDLAAAFLIGIVFQYFAVKSKKLNAFQAIIAALKADALSLIAWQIGMYGWMALVLFVIYGHVLPKNQPIFWFMMQIAMFIGFFTAYPVNYWLLKKGIKEAM